MLTMVASSFMKTRATTLEAISRQLLALKNRVSFLESALRQAGQKPSELAGIASRRDDAEKEARHEALKDYYEEERAKRYQRSPWVLQIDQEVEDSRNAFLRSRGFKPEPTGTPKEFRRKARRLVDKQRQP